jgi:FtsP/CotA-like multicopper oxidase with cupredoxin domain
MARTSSQDAPKARVHVYYIAADEVEWNYAPRGRNLASLPGFESEDTSKQTIFRKAIYREYTDATFTTLKSRSPQWEHLGILGPLIRAEVGDIVKVIFNNKTKIFCSMHPHGLAYAKESEGALYNDGVPSDEKKGAAVRPGEVFTYVWTVPERAGPAHGDSSSILWVYRSHFVSERDVNTGLMGPIIVTAKGASKIDGTPKDVDREFITAFAVFDETSSRYFEANTINTRKHSPQLRSTDPAFRAPYLMYSINGFIEGNMPMMTMNKGERVRWYLFSNGNEDDVHTPHWHAQTVEFMRMRTDMVQLEPMMMVTADMVPDNIGTWLFHCQVNDHLAGGMVALFTVIP